MRHLLLAILIVIGNSSCKKIIDIDLNDSDPVLVIEASVTKDSLLNWALITKSMNFNDAPLPPLVSNATIKLETNDGRSEEMRMIRPGFYISNSIRGEEGKEYTLTVEVEGKQYRAMSRIPTQIAMDSLTCKEEFGRGKTEYRITPHYQDPAGVENFYKFSITINGLPDPNINIRNDKYYDGAYTSRPLWTTNELKKGDTVRVEMECVDSNVYLFYYTLNRSQRMSSASPSNPVSNFTGGCLGCFRGKTSQTMEVIVE